MLVPKLPKLNRHRNKSGLQYPLTPDLDFFFPFQCHCKLCLPCCLDVEFNLVVHTSTGGGLHFFFFFLS